METYIQFEMFRGHIPQVRDYITCVTINDVVEMTVRTEIRPHMSDRVAWQTHYRVRRCTRLALRDPALIRWQGKKKCCR